MLALLKRIKVDAELRHVPVVMETGQDSLDRVRDGIEPYPWLKDALENLTAWPYARIDELLPLQRAATE
jgi:hypothetical protein